MPWASRAGIFLARQTRWFPASASPTPPRKRRWREMEIVLSAERRFNCFSLARRRKTFFALKMAGWMNMEVWRELISRWFMVRTSSEMIYAENGWSRASWQGSSGCGETSWLDRWRYQVLIREISLRLTQLHQSKGFNSWKMQLNSTSTYNTLWSPRHFWPRNPHHNPTQTFSPGFYPFIARSSFVFLLLTQI